MHHRLSLSSALLLLVVACRNESPGNGSASLGVDGEARPNGFVRVGLDWSSVLSDNTCADQTAIGNVWRVAPTSRLTYRYDPGSIADLRSAWSALPHEPVVVLGARKLAAHAFDAAWRVEALLQGEGRVPVARAWPVAGDTVDLAGIDVPAPLRTIPAFAALAAGGSHKLASPAEAGALIALTPGSAFGADGEGYVRLCFAASEGVLAEALTRLDAYMSARASVA